jgi:hypothetical protein
VVTAKLFILRPRMNLVNLSKFEEGSSPIDMKVEAGV